MILDNPFRRLGLPATASARDVRRCIEDAKVDLEIGSDDDAATELSRLRQQLEDPVQRVRHEVFWVHGDAVLVDVGDGPAVASATGALRETAGGSLSREQAIALHDLAVLSYAHYLACGNGDDPSAILSLWADVAGSEEFWRHLEERAMDACDARITPELVAEIRAGLPGAILGPMAAKAATLIDAGDLDCAAAIIRAVRSSGLSPDAIDVAVNEAVASIRASVDDGATFVRRMLDELRLSDGKTWLLRERLTAVENALVERVLAPLARLQAVDPSFADPTLGDRAATVTRRLAVAVCTALELWEWGYVLMRQALDAARSPALIAQLAAEQAEVATSYHRVIAAEAAHGGAAAESAAHTELALTYARTEEDRTAWRNLATGARRQHQITDEQLAQHKRSITSRLERHRRRMRERVETAAGLARVVAETPAQPPIPAVRRIGGGRVAVIVLVVLLVVLVLAVAAFGSDAAVTVAVDFAEYLPSQRIGADAT